MARLPTVKLYKGRSPHSPTQKLIVNAFDYQRNINRFAADGWKILSVRDITGTTDAVIREAASEAKANQFMKEDPAQAKKRGDHQRAFDERAIRQDIRTETPPVPSADLPVSDSSVDSVTNSGTQSDPKSEVDPDWPRMPWYQRRKYVADLTGETPENAEHAAELMQRHMAR